MAEGGQNEKLSHSVLKMGVGVPLFVVPHSYKRVVEGSLQLHSAVSCFLFHSVGYLLCPLEPLWQGFNQNRHRSFETLGLSCFLNKCSLLTNNKTLLKGEKPGPRSPCCQSPSVDHLEEGSEIIEQLCTGRQAYSHRERKRHFSDPCTVHILAES